MTSNIRKDILELSAAEKIELVQDIWDMVTDESTDRIPEAYMSEVARRVEELERDPTVGVPWEEVKARLVSKI